MATSFFVCYNVGNISNKESEQMGKIFYLMGKSGSGKDTVYKYIKERMPELGNIVIYTTRPIRSDEVDGVAYHFSDDEQLKKFQEDGKVIELREYNTIHGIWKYFTVDDGQFDTDDHLLAIGTLESYVQMRNYFGEEKMVPLYIEVEDGLRLERALKRERKQSSPKFEEMCRRFLADAKDFSEGNLKEAGIVVRYSNVELEDCITEIMLGIKENL